MSAAAGRVGNPIRKRGELVKNGRLVYSTHGGRVRGTDARPPSPQEAGPNLPRDGIVRIFRERGGRGGKVVTVIRGLPQRGQTLMDLAAGLKRFCGAGGTVKGGTVEIQGDQRERAAEYLRARGQAVKLAGG